MPPPPPPSPSSRTGARGQRGASGGNGGGGGLRPRRVALGPAGAPSASPRARAPGGRLRLRAGADAASRAAFFFPVPAERRSDAGWPRGAERARKPPLAPRHAPHPLARHAGRRREASAPPSRRREGGGGGGGGDGGAERGRAAGARSRPKKKKKKKRRAPPPCERARARAARPAPRARARSPRAQTPASRASHLIGGGEGCVACTEWRATARPAHCPSPRARARVAGNTFRNAQFRTHTEFITCKMT